jgi:uncharacterized surface protein with fasciclin (FAS1) repeats
MIEQDGLNRENETAEMEKAISKYRRLQPILEAEAPNAYVTIDAETGNYTVAADRRAASAAFREKYGTDRPAWTMHIGTT